MWVKESYNKLWQLLNEGQEHFIEAYRYMQGPKDPKLQTITTIFYSVATERVEL
ncbi:hypothetical protein DPMN_066639 [Dreissena polymorpha]|uniref:Uncharacterized protein n=1 Tax=Dreissena polymorpha TaxID=45954 RepID=A0A9D4BS77_DREPO|nr:hypothetical protein DPMN_066639 [Dreissena polymorpha]